MIIYNSSQISLMSRQKQASNREIKSVMLQRCDNMFANLQKEKSMNKYLRQSRRQPYDYKVFKKVSDCYLGDTYSQKENTQILEHACCMSGNLTELIESKVKTFVSQYLQRYIKQIFQDHKTGLQLFYRNELASIKSQCAIMQKQYEQMFTTFDEMMKKMQVGKQKSKNTEKYAKKVDVQQVQRSLGSQIAQIKAQIQNLNDEVQKLVVAKPKNIEERVQPLLLNYEQSSQIKLQDLRVVVQTFNHNFIQIDAKLKELFSKLS